MLAVLLLSCQLGACAYLGKRTSVENIVDGQYIKAGDWILVVENSGTISEIKVSKLDSEFIYGNEILYTYNKKNYLPIYTGTSTYVTQINRGDIKKVIKGREEMKKYHIAAMYYARHPNQIPKKLEGIEILTNFFAGVGKTLLIFLLFAGGGI